MSIIYGIISLIISILIPILILIFTGFQAMHFSLFFIVPVGALIIGYICGFGYYKGLFKSNIFITKKHFIIGILISLVCIFSIKYISYTFTCVDSEGTKLVYTLDGDHVSNYTVEDYGDLDFLTFTKYMIETTPVSFSYKARSIGNVSNPIFSWIFALIDFAGVILGVLLAGSIQKDHPYCHKCELYKTQKDIFKVSKSKGDSLFDELKTKFATMNLSQSIDLLCNYKLDESSSDEEHYLCKLIYCVNCRTSSLKFELYELNSKNKLEKNSDFKHEVDINYELADSLLNQELKSAAQNTVSS